MMRLYLKGLELKLEAMCHKKYITSYQFRKTLVKCLEATRTHHFIYYYRKYSNDVF